jgi:hypothetical protein
MASMPTPATVHLVTGDQLEVVILHRAMDKATEAVTRTQLNLNKMVGTALRTGPMEEQKVTR